VKFTAAEREVRLGARIQQGSELMDYPIAGNWSGKWLNVWVSDTGIGLVHKDLARVFNALEQVEGSASRRYGARDGGWQSLAGWWNCIPALSGPKATALEEEAPSSSLFRFEAPSIMKFKMASSRIPSR